MLSTVASPNWSAPALAIWGKTDATSGDWLRLTTHLEDSARVMDHLWESLPESIARNYILWAGSDTHARALLAFLAGVHDVGKASSFQLKAQHIPGSDSLPDFSSRLQGVGVELPTVPDVGVRHGAVGQIALHDWLKTQHGWSPLVATRLAGIVGGHHGVNPASKDLQDIRNRRHTWDSPSLNAVRLEILDKMAEFTGALSLLPDWATRKLPIELQILSEALVIQTDWIASNTELFPLIEGPDGADRARRGWEELDLPGRWLPTSVPADSADLLHTRFPNLAHLSPNAMQSAVVEGARSMAHAGLMIIEAPMGSGKTEAALMAAEVLSSKFGTNGVFVGLPTMATANPMFARVRSWLAHVPTNSPTSVNLAHGKAALNPEFHGLMADARMSSMGDDPKDIAQDSGGEQQVLVHEWTTGRKKGLLAQHVIGTIDQLLFAGLKAKHVVLRHLGLASKLVIVDEVHAADHFMRVYLKRVLEWLGSYGTPVILMSATLPPAQRLEYLSAYAGTEPRIAASTEEDAYPRITLLDGDEVRTLNVSQDAPPRQVSLELAPADFSLATHLREKLANGGCAAVIRNTVGSAQKTYQELREALPDVELLLLHSRFLAPHRIEREAALVSRLGRDGARPERLVVVGTQVLEQSLDVDFDLLISDVAPTDLLMQRMGRLHRHDRERRPAGLETPTVVVTGVSDDGGVPAFDRGSQFIYGNESLLRTIATLFPPGRTTCTIELPLGIAGAVRAAYAPNIVMPDQWSALFSAERDKASTKRAESVRNAEAFVLGDPLTSNLNGFTTGRGSDPEDPKGYARVRDGEDSFEVLVLRLDPDGTVRLPPSIGGEQGRVVPTQLTASRDDQELARLMATYSVPLPMQLSHNGIVDTVIADLESQRDVSGWQGSPWVQGELFLFLDSAGVARLSVGPVSYSDEIGLIVDSATSKEA